MFHKTLMIATVAGASTIAACASGTSVHSAGGEVAPAVPATSAFIPAGASVTARFDQSISTENHEGDHFTATVINNLYAQNGSVAIPEGARIHGIVTGVHSAKVPGEKNVIRLNVDQLVMHDRTYPFDANISDVKVENASGASNKTIRNSAIGAVAGGALGALVTGGEAAGLIAGGLLGAGAGAVISLGNGSNEPATIPAGSTVTVQATQGLHVH